MRPQTLGAIIARTGVRKSKDMKGNFYDYSTEGYRFYHWIGKTYKLQYVNKFSFSESESQRERFNSRKREAIDKIVQALEARGVKVACEVGSLTLEIELD